MTAILTATTTTCVLIAGAGPTGLMMACQLARRDIPFRIIEKNSGPTTQSRALAVQARSLEIFAQMGIAQTAVEQGKPAKAVNYVSRGKLVQQISLAGHGEALTAFPYLLILDQSRTEQLLIDDLAGYGHAIEWQTELLAFTEAHQQVEATLKRLDGTTERVKAKWLVGADGAKSTVREGLDIPFGGKTYPASLYVLDCKVRLPFREDEGYIAFSDTSFAAFFPMSEGRCRVISLLPETLSQKDGITFEDVAGDFAERMQMDVRLSDPKWISTYHAHHRYVATFRKGHCFLAGDAAHIHSPVGAQGMNTGLQDAYNLAWKLALVISGKASPDLLETYNEERLPIAKSLVQTTDRVFNLTLNMNRLARFGLMFLAPKALALVLRVRPLARLAFTTISQIGIHYRQSRLSQDASFGGFPRHAPRPGDRLPFIEFQEGTKTINVQDKIKASGLHLLLFRGTHNDTHIQPVIGLADRYRETVSVETIPLTSDTRLLYEALGLQTGGYYLVRPDLYIACRSTTLDAVTFERYVERFLLSDSDSASKTGEYQGDAQPESVIR